MAKNEVMSGFSLSRHAASVASVETCSNSRDMSQQSYLVETCRKTDSTCRDKVSLASTDIIKIHAAAVVSGSIDNIALAAAKKRKAEAQLADRAATTRFDLMQFASPR